MAHERTAASTNLRYGSWNSVEECAARARETRGAAQCSTETVNPSKP